MHSGDKYLKILILNPNQTRVLYLQKRVLVRRLAVAAIMRYRISLKREKLLILNRMGLKSKKH